MLYSYFCTLQNCRHWPPESKHDLVDTAWHFPDTHTAVCGRRLSTFPNSYFLNHLTSIPHIRNKKKRHDFLATPTRLYITHILRERFLYTLTRVTCAMQEINMANSRKSLHHPHKPYITTFSVPRSYQKKAAYLILNEWTTSSQTPKRPTPTLCPELPNGYAKRSYGTATVRRTDAYLQVRLLDVRNENEDGGNGRKRTGRELAGRAQNQN